MRGRLDPISCQWECRVMSSLQMPVQLSLKKQNLQLLSQQFTSSPLEAVSTGGPHRNSREKVQKAFFRTTQSWAPSTCLEYHSALRAGPAPCGNAHEPGHRMLREETRLWQVLGQNASRGDCAQQATPQTQDELMAREEEEGMDCC